MEEFMKLKTLRDLFVEELKDLYSAEKQILKALPKMAKAASSAELRQAFTDHLEQTRGQVERLDKIFEQLDTSSRGKKCAAMEGLIDEGKQLMEEEAEDAVMDAALIAAAQKVEHYEIAGYGCARTYARMLGEEQAARLLQQTLEEEAHTDKRLSALAEGFINAQAAAGAAAG